MTEKSKCLTPGAIYHTEISFRHVVCSVGWPDTLPGLENLIDDVRHKGDTPRRTYEDILHDHMERAVAEIWALNSTRRFRP